MIIHIYMKGAYLELIKYQLGCELCAKDRIWVNNHYIMQVNGLMRLLGNLYVMRLCDYMLIVNYMVIR